MPNTLESHPTPSSAMLESLPKLAEHHRMPDVIFIGAAKSATTFLTHLIAQHPKIGTCGMREPNFFSHPDQFARGLEWYSHLYDDVGEDQLAFDSSTGYTQWPQLSDASDLIAHYAPRAKLIYLMREPVERAYSHYIHRWTKECHVGEPFTRTFEQYMVEDPMCIDGSDYQAQIGRYLRHFSPDSLLCLFTFEVRRNPQAVLQRVCRFLEIDDDAANFQQRPASDNRGDDFFEARVRVDVTNRIKRLPVVKQLLPCVPERLREAIYQRLRRSPWGQSAAGQLDAPPLSDEVRSRFRERFAASNAWVAEFTHQDLSCWND